MKEVIFGIVSGTVAALGMGGGTILIMLLNIFTKLNQHLIQGINLIFFIPTAIVSIYLNIKNKIIDYKISAIIIIFGIIGAVVGANISFKINSQNLKKYFGYFLLLIAILETFQFFKKYILIKKEDNNSDKLDKK